MAERRALSRARLLAWTGPCWPTSAIGLPLVVYLPPYYAGTLGLPLATVGFLFMLVRLIDIPIDPVLGGLIDRTRSRFGQFRPWLAVGMLLLALGTALVFFAPPGLSAGRALGGLLVLYAGFSCVVLAQTSWGATLSTDYAERARIFGWWNAMNVAGLLAVLFVPPAAAFVTGREDPALGVHAIAWFVLVQVAVTGWFALTAVPAGEAPPPEHRAKASEVWRVLADRRMQRLLGVDLLISLTPGITGALLVFFFTAARGYSPAQASVLLLFYFAAGLVAMPFWIAAARRLGKHRAAAGAALWLGAAQLGVMLLPPDNMPVAAAGMFSAGLAFAAPPFLLRAMLADLADAQRLDRRQHGRAEADTTGLNFALLTATAKLGYALPVGLAYPVLAAIGFDPAPGAVNSPEAIDGLVALFILPPLVMAWTAAALVWFWPINAEAHARIREALQR